MILLNSTSSSSSSRWREIRDTISGNTCTRVDAAFVSRRIFISGSPTTLTRLLFYQGSVRGSFQSQNLYRLSMLFEFDQYRLHLRIFVTQKTLHGSIFKMRSVTWVRKKISSRVFLHFHPIAFSRKFFPSCVGPISKCTVIWFCWSPLVRQPPEPMI